MSGFDAARNLGLKAARRVWALHKPAVRAMRRRSRAQEQLAFREEAEQAEREIRALARGTGPIVAGPWLAEVGYEVLYWIPFLRWVADACGLPRDRLVVVSRGGLDALYAELAGTYIDIFDLMPPDVWAARNAARQAAHEGGGQKQSGAASALDDEILALVRARMGIPPAGVCHPSLLFRLFRHVWHGNLAADVFWTHTRYARTTLAGDPTLPALPDVPADFIAAKLYTGPALSAAPTTRAAVRALVEQAARVAPVVLLDTELGLDEHRDHDLLDVPGVKSVGRFMTPRDNLGIQLALIARSRYFLGTCGGLAWLAPFLGVPTVAVYDSDHLLGPHLAIARQAGRSVGAAEFAPLDLRAVARVDLLRPAASQP